MAEIDSSRGLQDPADVARRMRGPQTTAPVQAAVDGTLGDSTIANNLRQQATKMAAEARGLLAESNRMMKEAASMDGVGLETTSSVLAEPIKRGRGRPAKVKVTS
jgi:hypothetical protein